MPMLNDSTTPAPTMEALYEGCPSAEGSRLVPGYFPSPCTVIRKDMLRMFTVPCSGIRKRLGLRSRLYHEQDKRQMNPPCESCQQRHGRALDSM